MYWMRRFQSEAHVGDHVNKVSLPQATSTLSTGLPQVSALTSLW